MKARFINENLEIKERLMSPEVSYMEIKGEHFACEYCTFFNSKNSFCNNKKVQSKVNGENGCCNLFNPFPENKVSSDNWNI
jgi:hypothetical protein